jgi:CBS-domain-containing membrane protein
MAHFLASKSPLKYDKKSYLFIFIGGTLTIYILSLLTHLTNFLLIMAPFGASCVIIYAVWEAPIAQPRNIIGGHFLTGIVGFIMLSLFGNNIYSIAFSVGIALALMLMTKTTHPPAGANSIIVITSEANWHYLFFPILFGAIVITIIGILLNKYIFKRSYPKFIY